jgi:hypothetical protein
MNFKNFLTVTLLVTLSTLFVSCSKPNGEDKFGISKNAKAAVYIRKTPCYGKCPAYEATLYGNGQVLYNGKSNVELLGRYLFTLPVKTINNIQNQARRAGYHKLNKEYMVNPDLPSVITTITYDGKTSTIEVQGNAPDRLKDLLVFIDQEVMTMTKEQPGKKLPEDDTMPDLK